MKKFNLIVPCYNEEQSLDVLVRKRILTLKDKCAQEYDLDLELIIVNDASTDKSLELATKLQKEFSWIKVLTHKINQGKGAAIKTGLAYADGDYVGIQDADEEYNPMNYLKLLQPMLEGKADVVYGSRYLRPDNRRILSFWHTLMNKFLTLCSNMFSGLDITDMETCYKLFTGKVAKELAAKLEEPRFGFEPEITAYVAQGKYRLWECAIDYVPRTYEEGKKITYKDGFRALYCILHYNSPWAPLPMQILLYIFIGGICALVNLLFFLIFREFLSLYGAVAGAFFGAAILNYWLCTVLLFSHKPFWSGKTECLLYILTMFVMGSCDMFLTYVMMTCGMGSGAAKLIASLICFWGNFAFRKYLVFPLPKGFKS